MNAAGAESHPVPVTETKPPGRASWTLSRWLMLVALIYAAHVILLFAFGGYKSKPPRALTDVPMLQYAADDGLLALNDPTLFALPHRRDFAAAILNPPPTVQQPAFHWVEPSGGLPLSGADLGTVFNAYMRTNRFAGYELQLRPPLKFSSPELPIEPVLPQASTLQIQGDLVHRRLIDPIDLPSWPYPDVIAPSIVQVVVDPGGNVVSVALLPPDNGAAAHYDQADTRALDLARAARFSPGPRLTIGRMIFHWHTVPPPHPSETEAPASP